MATVYLHRRTDTGEIFYVGIGKTIKRAYSKISRSKPWHSMTKNREYNVEIVKDGITWEEACDMEKRLIKEHGRRDLGLGTLVNMTDGGDGVHNLSKETRKKMAVNKGLFGEKNYFYGRKHTQESNQKNREAHLGKESVFKGKRHSEESKQKNREAHLGATPANKGKVCMNNGVKNKYVKKEEVGKHMELGWVNGSKYDPPARGIPSAIKNKIAINNKQIIKYIEKQYLDSYINDGWELGMIKRKK